jgi:type I restriction enzyme S subunit
MMQIHQYPQYDSYQSDVTPWLGHVPSDWAFEKAKWHLSNKKKLNSDGLNQNVLSLTLRGVVNNDPENPEGLVPSDYRTYQIFDENDLVFKLIDLENVRTSRVGLVHENGIMSSAYIRIVANERWSVRFLYYFYFHLYQAEIFNKIGSGVRSTLGPKDLLELPVPVIPRDTQERIVSFLDRKNNQIDEAIKVKQDQIELLKERKQIIVQESVTKGLNPKAPLKDSGIDWIGEIPAHWRVHRSKYLFSQRKEFARRDDIQLSATQAYGVIPQDRFEELVGRRVVKITTNLEKRKHVELDDFVISMRSFQGGLERAYASGCIRSSYVILKPSEAVCSDYFGYLLKSPRYIRALQITGNFIRDGQDLTFENFSEVDLFVPPYREQQIIADYISQQLSKVDQAIELKEQQIEGLREYRETLINSAVTGKIRVI